MDRLRKMEIFVSVVEAGKFTTAARNLGLSKSAVSHAVRDLELYLNVQIINRESKGLSLTAAGQDYYEECCRILSDIGEMEKGIRHEEKSYAGHIRISAPTSFGSTEIAPLVAEFSKLHPDITITLDLANRYVDLIEEGYDIGIRGAGRTNANLLVREVLPVQMVLVASPKFAQEHPDLAVPIDLASLNCMRFSEVKTWTFTKNGRTHSVTPSGSLMSDSGEVLLAYALAGRGVAYLPNILTDGLMGEGRLVKILPSFDGLIMKTHIAYAQNRHKSQRVRALVDFLADALGPDSERAKKIYT